MPTNHLPGVYPEASFDQLFRQYYPALCQFAGHYLPDDGAAEDLVQDCFVRLWEQPRFPADAAHAPALLYTMVRNQCIDRLRRQQVQSKRVADYQYLADQWSGEELSELTRADTMRRVQEALAALPPKMQTVFKLRWLEGMSYQQIAAELGIAPHTARNQQQRALTLLKGKLTQLILGLWVCLMKVSAINFN